MTTLFGFVRDAARTPGAVGGGGGGRVVRRTGRGHRRGGAGALDRLRSLLERGALRARARSVLPRLAHDESLVGRGVRIQSLVLTLLVGDLGGLARVYV